MKMSFNISLIKIEESAAFPKRTDIDILAHATNRFPLDRINLIPIYEELLVCRNEPDGEQ